MLTPQGPGFISPVFFLQHFTTLACGQQGCPGENLLCLEVYNAAFLKTKFFWERKSRLLSCYFLT